MLESDPLNVIEGMIIGGFAIGAHQGFVYVRAEYPMAIRANPTGHRTVSPVGAFGQKHLGLGLRFRSGNPPGRRGIRLRRRDGVDPFDRGRARQPRVRPPYPTESGLWGKPTVINNVETFANVPAVINYGADWFARIGTVKSGGTKVFALAGKIRHTGLVEVPMGTKLQTIIYDIGGGVDSGRQLKAIQTGGPAGGCIPAKWIDLARLRHLTKAGSIMGSGGMIVLDEDDCMVDIAKYFMTSRKTSRAANAPPVARAPRGCWKSSNASPRQRHVGSLDKLKRLGFVDASGVALRPRRAAANPILSTLEHFHNEYLAHVTERRCPAHKCKGVGALRDQSRQVRRLHGVRAELSGDVYFGVRKEAHLIDQLRCIKCGRCSRFAGLTRSKDVASCKAATSGEDEG